MTGGTPDQGIEAETTTMPEPPEAETPAENQTEEQNQESLELIKQFAPEADTSTPEGLIAGLTEALKKLAPFQKKIRDVVEEDIEAAAFMYDMIETGDVLKSLARNYSAEELQAVLDGMEEDDFEGDRKMYSDRINSVKAKNEELQNNMKLSEVSAGEFMDKVNMSDEDIDGFEKYYKEFLSDAVNNKMTVQHWESLWKGYKHDPDVEEAESNGKVMGRNEKIVTQKAGKKDLEALLPEANASMGMSPKTEKPQSFKDKFIEGVL